MGIGKPAPAKTCCTVLMLELELFGMVLMHGFQCAVQCSVQQIVFGVKCVVHSEQCAVRTLKCAVHTLK